MPLNVMSSKTRFPERTAFLISFTAAQKPSATRICCLRKFDDMPWKLMSSNSMLPFRDQRPESTSRCNSDTAAANPVLGALLLEPPPERSEEHTSELQSRENLVCRLLLEKKKKHH